MKCLLCNQEMNVDLVDDEGHIDTSKQYKCEPCHAVWTFSDKNRVVDGALTGLGAAIRYDYNTKPLAPLPRKK